MTKKKKETIYASEFYSMANDEAKYPTEIEELEKRDLTDLLLTEIHEMIDNGELLNISIRGPVRKGKSAAGITLAKYHIHPILIQLKHTKDKFTINNIARDDQEKTKMMKDNKLHHTVVVVDEKNALEETGENVTVEQKLKRVFSEVQAGRYVHTINIAPVEIDDPNSDIILELIDKDKHTKKTWFKLYYKLLMGGTPQEIFLGIVKIYVWPLIKNWEQRSKRLFFKTNKTKAEKQLLQRWAKKDLFTNYQIRKYQKMELITKHGVFQPRKLDYAEATKETLNELRKIAQICPKALTKSMIRNYVKKNARKHKIEQSIIGEELATRDIEGILDIYKSVEKVDIELSKLRKQFKTNKLDHTQYTRIHEELYEAKKELERSIKIQEHEIDTLIAINEEYHQTTRQHVRSKAPFQVGNKLQPK